MMANNRLREKIRGCIGAAQGRRAWQGERHETVPNPLDFMSPSFALPGSAFHPVNRLARRTRTRPFPWLLLLQCCCLVRTAPRRSSLRLSASPQRRDRMPGYTR